MRLPLSSISITDAAPADAGELLTVQRAAYLSEGALHESFRLPPLLETLDEIRAAIGSVVFLKAQLGTRIVGAARARHDGDTCHIGRLAVAPDLQGHGIGSQLVRALEARFDGRANRFELFTGPRSEPNVRLYRRLGYTDIPAPAGSELIFLEKRV